MLALVEVFFFRGVLKERDGIKLSVRSEKSSLDAGKITAERRCRGSETAAGMLRWQVALYRLPVPDGKAVILIDQIKERFFSTIAKRR